MGRCCRNTGIHFQTWVVVPEIVFVTNRLHSTFQALFPIRARGARRCSIRERINRSMCSLAGGIRERRLSSSDDVRPQQVHEGCNIYIYIYIVLRNEILTIALIGPCVRTGCRQRSGWTDPSAREASRPAGVRTVRPPSGSSDGGGSTGACKIQSSTLGRPFKQFPS